MPGFYSIKTFDGFRFDEVPCRLLFSGLSPELRIYQYQNQPGDVWQVGTGKTFLSIALGVEPAKRD